MKPTNEYLKSMRRSYSDGELIESHLCDNPFDQFDIWMKLAISSGNPEVNAMILSTATKDNNISSRVVLLRGFSSENGFIFYTNYNSKKSRDIFENNQASLLFYWPEIMRQVRIEGVIEKVSKQDSDEYFKSRPRENQIGAWASNQSEVVNDRQVLDDQFKMYEEKFKDIEVPRPENWGGFALNADYIEFWQGRVGRLHDRISYKKNNDNWKIQRLSP
ncbi:MAG TPA: pyridoxamine 5'-phosphate oxidase [Bacteroidia bacterium]|nr:pyridoxamine 5'-phosphate oxidase [Bacteroidia bacterium]